MSGILHRKRDTLWKRPFHKQNPELVTGGAQRSQLFYCALQVCNLGTAYLQLRVGLRSSYTNNNSPPDQYMTIPLLPLSLLLWQWRGYCWAYRTHRENFVLRNHQQGTHFFPENSINITARALQEFPRPQQYLLRCTKPVFAKSEFRHNLANPLQGQQDTTKANFACYSASSVRTVSLRG